MPRSGVSGAWPDLLWNSVLLPFLTLTFLSDPRGRTVTFKILFVCCFEMVLLHRVRRLRTHCIDQAGLKLIEEICLLLFPSAGIKGMLHVAIPFN